MTLHNKKVGSIGETEAVNYLRGQGYKIIKQNFHTRWGELDIIAAKEQKISFVEVKTRIGDKYGKPHESITTFKLHHLKRPIQYFLLQNDFKNYKLSLDVISVILNEDQSVKSLKYFDNVTAYK